MCFHLKKKKVEISFLPIDTFMKYHVYISLPIRLDISLSRIHIYFTAYKTLYQWHFSTEKHDIWYIAALVSIIHSKEKRC